MLLAPNIPSSVIIPPPMLDETWVDLSTTETSFFLSFFKLMKLIKYIEFWLNNWSERNHYFNFIDQSMSVTGLSRSRLALVSPRCGDKSPHLPLDLPPPLDLKEVDQASMPIKDWHGIHILISRVCSKSRVRVTLKGFIIKYLNKLNWTILYRLLRIP